MLMKGYDKESGLANVLAGPPADEVPRLLQTVVMQPPLQRFRLYCGALE